MRIDVGRILRSCGAVAGVAAVAVFTVVATSSASAQRPGRKAAGSGQQGAPAASLRSPSASDLAKAGPDSFDVAFHTTKGTFTVRMSRAMSPRGADRVWHAVQARYYDGVRFYRVIRGFMAQFGFHGNPAVTAAWESHVLRDDPRNASNTRGMVTFATRGPGTRTVQLFVNMRDNVNLDALGFVPVGRVRDGMPVVDSLYGGYGEGAPRGNGPDQDRIASEGNAYLALKFPKLDVIDSARVVNRWPEQ